MQSELSKLRESAPPHCKVHTEEQFEALSYQGQATARHRDMKVLHQFLSSRSWRVADIVTVLSRLGYLESAWETKE
eukprot:2616468-Pleurochrysis_carterae.AAC.1